MVAIRQHDVTSTILIAFPLSYYLVMGSTQHYFARYALPLVPFIVLFAADFIVVTYAWLAIKNRPVALVITTVLILGALTVPLLDSIQHDVLLTQIDTRTLAKQWIEVNIPSGAKIAADWPIHTPYLSSTSRVSTTQPGKVYDINYVGGTGLSDHTLDWYRQQGFEYLIASSFVYDIPLVFPKQDADRKAFYLLLQKQLPLIKEFSGGRDGVDPPFLFDEIYGPAISLWQRERPGPTLKIYQLASQ